MSYVLLTKSDPHHPFSDLIWENPTTGPYCIREDSLNGKDTDAMIRIDSLDAETIRAMLSEIGLTRIAEVYEVTRVKFYQEIPFSPLQRDLGYYFVKCGRNHEEFTLLFADANRQRNFATHQLYLLRGGWLLAIMSGDRLCDFNDFMKNFFYNKTGKIIDASYLLNILEVRRTTGLQTRTDVIADFRKIIRVLGGVKAMIVDVLLERDAGFGDLVHTIQCSESQVWRDLQILQTTGIVEKRLEDGKYALHKKRLRPLYSYARSR